MDKSGPGGLTPPWQCQVLQSALLPLLPCVRDHPPQVATNTKGASKVILDEVTGYVEPCHMLAIMGPSGCGKTTLLDTLAGRLPSNVDTSGEVRAIQGRTRSLLIHSFLLQEILMIACIHAYVCMPGQRFPSLPNRPLHLRADADALGRLLPRRCA